MKSKISSVLVSLLVLLSAFHSFSQRAIPPLEGKRIHDEANVLSSQTVEQLEVQLKHYEDSTSNQIAILIIKSLEGDVLEEYSIRVAHNEWKLGQSKNDNGVLLLIAVDDRKMRIEVGYGLEGVLTDALTSRIIRNEMAPNFRRGDYDAGVLLAINAIVRAIGGEYVADEESSEEINTLSSSDKILVSLVVFGLLGIFSFSGLTSQGAIGWVFYFFLIPFYAVFPMVVLGWKSGLSALGIYLVGYPILKVIFKKMGWTKKDTGTGGRNRGGGWSSGAGWFTGGSSGGGSWGGGGGGGFSGGGGGFGGGGSSGSW